MEVADVLSFNYRQAKRGRTWLTIQPDAVAKALGEDRGRVVRALAQ